MNYIIILYLLFIVLVSCQQQHGFESCININIPKCVECTAVLLDPYFKEINNSTYFNKKHVIKSNNIKPGIYVIKVNGLNKRLPLIRIYLPADSVCVNIVDDSILYKKYYRLYNGLNAGSYLIKIHVVSTSAKQHELEEYLLLRDSVWNKAFVDKDLLEAKMIQTYSLHNKILIEKWSDSVRNFDVARYMASAADVFAKRYPQSDVTLYALNDVLYEGSVSRFRSYYLAMSDSLRQSMYGSMLREKLEKYK